jgi:hypothetical protein
VDIAAKPNPRVGRPALDSPPRAFPRTLDLVNGWEITGLVLLVLVLALFAYVVIRVVWGQGEAEPAGSGLKFLRRR